MDIWAAAIRCRGYASGFGLLPRCGNTAFSAVFARGMRKDFRACTKKVRAAYGVVNAIAARDGRIELPSEIARRQKRLDAVDGGIELADEARIAKAAAGLVDLIAQKDFVIGHADHAHGLHGLVQIFFVGFGVTHAAETNHNQFFVAFAGERHAGVNRIKEAVEAVDEDFGRTGDLPKINRREENDGIAGIQAREKVCHVVFLNATSDVTALAGITGHAGKDVFVAKREDFDDIGLGVCGDCVRGDFAVAVPARAAIDDKDFLHKSS